MIDDPIAVTDPDYIFACQLIDTTLDDPTDDINQLVTRLVKENRDLRLVLEGRKK